MSEGALYPDYIPRAEERDIRDQASLVHLDGQSRVVLLYGPGGIGKTLLVRHLSASEALDGITWLDPIDVDDSEYWLLSNLERHIADRLDPNGSYFRPYRDHLSQLATYTRPRISHDTVVSHLGQIKRVFIDCYNQFVKDTGSTVVIGFDTIEAVRGISFLLTLTQWIKALHSTLFILSGRPVPDDGDGDDPVQRELLDNPQGLPVTTIQLAEFSQEAAVGYLSSSPITSGLGPELIAKLVQMTRGHPLWLAFVISYLEDSDIPEEAGAPLSVIEREVPFRGDMTAEGQLIYEAFKRRLVTPYQASDFWHESVKRLAVVRQAVSKDIWQELMSDRPLPSGLADLDAAWEELLKIPWIRPRANGRFVTLHDAVAEELAQRIIPVHDQGKQGRRELWRRAVRIYTDLTEGPEAALNELLAASDEQLQQLEERLRRSGEPDISGRESAYIDEVARLDALKRDIDQFKAARLFYLLLSDFADGCQQFLRLFRQAGQQNDVLFQELLALEMQRFLPGGVHRYAFGDVIGGVINDFRSWLTTENPDLYLAIGLTMADYLVKDEQPRQALEMLHALPTSDAEPRQLYQVSDLMGNAYMRIPGSVLQAATYFEEALEVARSANSHMLIAAAYKELGYFYRNEGMWEKADDAYKEARDAISATLSARSTDEDREEMASIQTNWAYVKGLVGSYREGADLVESAIKVRHRLNRPLEEGFSWSVCGEVRRYERRFHKAWEAYATAEQIFHSQQAWPWLGLIYQEQAICLVQATQDGISLVGEPIPRAKQLITLALDICRNQQLRAYPSALNRAGRIFSHDSLEDGFSYLATGIEEADRLRDGWFLFANRIEYVELCYRAWLKSGDQSYRDEIESRAPDIRRVMGEYSFPDLRGRWDLLQGHLAIHDAVDSEDYSGLDAALDRYKEGFALIAQHFVGSSGKAALPGEFETFAELLLQLPHEIREQWLEELRATWSRLEYSTPLLARLEELY